MIGAPGGADLAVDLGTTRTRLIDRTGQVVADVPTVVAFRHGREGRTLAAWGPTALDMAGRTGPETRVVRPVTGGMIGDYDACEALLAALLQPFTGRIARPRLLTPVPPGATETERRALLECVRSAGARKVALVPGPLVAAIGAGLPVSKPRGSLVVEIGGGRTELAVVSLDGIVVRRAVRIAGEALDAGIVHWLKRHKRLLVGDAPAERLKHRLGITGRGESVQIHGRDLRTGAPRTVEITSAEVAQAMGDPLDRIETTLLEGLRETPPELAGDILEQGALLVGGGAKLRGLGARLRQSTDVAFLSAEQPELARARGLGMLLQDAALADRMVPTRVAR